MYKDLRKEIRRDRRREFYRMNWSNSHLNTLRSIVCKVGK